MTWFGPRDPQEKHGFALIGVEIRRRRLLLGWSQRVLERYSGIDQTVISRLENGKQFGMRWTRFARLVDALGGIGPSASRNLPAAIDLDLDLDLDLDRDRDRDPDPDRDDPHGC